MAGVAGAVWDGTSTARTAPLLHGGSRRWGGTGQLLGSGQGLVLQLGEGHTAIHVRFAKFIQLQVCALHPLSVILTSKVPQDAPALIVKVTAPLGD